MLSAVPIGGFGRGKAAGGEIAIAEQARGNRRPAGCARRRARPAECAEATSLAASAICALVAKPSSPELTLPPNIGRAAHLGSPGRRSQRRSRSVKRRSVRSPGGSTWSWHFLPVVLCLMRSCAAPVRPSSRARACRSSSWSSASVTSCWAERPVTAQARRSLRWRDGSSRSVKAALPLLPGASARRGVAGRRGTGAGSQLRAESRATGRRLADRLGRSVVAARTRPRSVVGVFRFRIIELGGLVDIFAVLVLAILVMSGEAVGDFGLLVVDRRSDRRQRGEIGLRSGWSDSSSPNAS